MASAESTSTSSVGPRYAPDDPTLPKPWKGLIDGSTGLLYYWNPESNVTQYDRPTSFNPPLPPGPHPSASTPKLAPISLAVTQTTDASGAPQQHGQPAVQQQLSVALQMALQNFQQLKYQHTQPIVNQQPQQPYPQFQVPQPIVNQQPQQPYPQFQVPQLQYPPVTYLQGQLGGQTQAPEQQQQGSQVPIHQHQGIEVPYQQQQGSQGSYPQQQQQQVAEVQHLQQQLQGSQVPYQQQHPQQPRMPFLIGQQPGQQQEQLQRQQLEGQQSAVYRQAKEPQNQQIASHQQGQWTGIPRIEEPVRQEGKQAGFSLSQVQENELMSSNHQLSSIATEAQVSNRAILVQSQHQQHQQFTGPTSAGQQFGGLSSSGLQFGGAPGGQRIGGTLGGQRSSGAPGGEQFGGSFASQQFSGLSSGGKQSVGQVAGVSPVRLQQARMDSGYRQQQIGSHMIPTQAAQAIARSVGSQMGHEEDWRERPGNEFYSSSRNEGMMLSQQPELAPSSLVRNPQETRTSAVHPHFISPGHLGSSNMVPGHPMPNMHNHAPFPSATPIRPPSRMFDSPEFTGINVAKPYRDHHDVTAMGDNVPAPFMTLEATGFPPEIVRELHLAGFWSPTPIQAQTWPVALQSRDIVAIARTGSGKTLSYLIPAFIHLRRCRNNPHFGPTVLVLAPTRELATQIQDEAIKFGHSSRVSCTCLYGGAPKGPQLREIERGVDILVATPGRLHEILEMKKINFRQISLLVLDEADRMLDMGFEPEIRKIVNEIPPHRQTLMYTATWPNEVRKIAGDLLANPVQVTIGSVDELAANKSITQFVEVVHPSDRQLRLEEILRSQEQASKIIIFCSTKKLCDDLVYNLGRHFGAASIHGDKSQGERDHALHQFRCGRAPILIATDVAARGLDIKDIRVVINYDFPTGIEDYVHRIGRTGRAGATGVSYTFFSGQDWKHATELIKVLEGANQRVPPELREMAARGGGPGSGRWDSSGGRGYRDRWDSGGGRGDGGRWDIGGGRGNGMRDSVGGQDFGERDGGGRNEFYGGREIGRGRGFRGPGRPGGHGRHDRGPHDRYYNYPDVRGRYDRDSRRVYRERSRGRSYSRSPEKVRSRGYDRSRSRSRSWSRSPSRNRSRSRSRSRSSNYDRYNRVPRSLFTDAPNVAATAGGSGATRFETHPTLFTIADGGNGASKFEASDASGFKDGSLSGHMSPMSPGKANGLFSRNEIRDQVAMADGRSLGFSQTEPDSEPGRLFGGV